MDRGKKAKGRMHETVLQHLLGYETKRNNRGFLGKCILRKESECLFKTCALMIYSISPSLLVQRRSMISSAGTGYVQSL